MTEQEFELKMERKWAEYKRERNARLHRFTVKALIIFAILGLTTSATAYYVYSIGKNNREGLCAIRADAERKIAQTDEVIKENPDGLGEISVDQLERSKNNSVQTREALGDLHCPQDSKGVIK